MQDVHCCCADAPAAKQHELNDLTCRGMGRLDVAIWGVWPRTDVSWLSKSYLVARYGRVCSWM